MKLSLPVWRQSPGPMFPGRFARLVLELKDWKDEPPYPPLPPAVSCTQLLCQPPFSYPRRLGAWYGLWMLVWKDLGSKPTDSSRCPPVLGSATALVQGADLLVGGWTLDQIIRQALRDHLRSPENSPHLSPPPPPVQQQFPQGKN